MLAGCCSRRAPVAACPRYAWDYRTESREANVPVGLSEDDVSVKFITPALHRAGWDEDTQIRRQVPFTKGRTIVRSKPKRADFVLYHQHIAIALIEAKKAHVRPCGWGRIKSDALFGPGNGGDDGFS